MLPARVNTSINVFDRAAAERSHVRWPGAVSTTSDTLSAALTYLTLGLSVVPVRTDGSKAPLISGWRAFSDRHPTLSEFENWFSRPGVAGIGITGGKASGNLVVLDFETRDVFYQWSKRLTDEDRSLLARCPLIRTPRGGRHVYLRLTESVTGAKYARTAAGECLIETRGAGHFVVAPGSPASCHKSGRAYEIWKEGWLDGSPAESVPLSTFRHLTFLAAELNEYVRPAAREVVDNRPARIAGETRPGDDFNARAAWGDILGPHGWRVFRTCHNSVGPVYWTRPGKDGGVSASTNFCVGEDGRDLLYVFTTSAPPFEANKGYSRFAAYALLNHHGDYRSAARALASAGYGNRLHGGKP